MDKYIEREAAIEAIMCEPPDAHYPHWYADKIKAIPAADVAPVRRGRWISYLDGDSIMPDRYYRCSECCDRGWGRKWPYCPNCGAKMDGGTN